MTKPRSLLLDLYGDYLRYAGPDVRTGDLVTLMSVLGVEPATTRMTLSRLRQEGWFSTTKSGRETRYRLSDAMFAVLDEGRDRIFAPYPDAWDGWWTQVVFQTPEGGRAEREDLKKRLAWLGFGPLGPGVWLTPRPVPARELADLREQHPDASIEVLRSRGDDLAQDRRLVERCWDVAALDADYARFIDAHAPLVAGVADLTGADAFLGSMSLVSVYRHFPFRDPALPPALRTPGWRGAEAHALFLGLHELLRPEAESWVRGVTAPITA